MQHLIPLLSIAYSCVYMQTLQWFIAWKTCMHTYIAAHRGIHVAQYCISQTYICMANWWFYCCRLGNISILKPNLQYGTAHMQCRTHLQVNVKYSCACSILFTCMSNFAYVYYYYYQFLSARNWKDHTRGRITIYLHMQ